MSADMNKRFSQALRRIMGRLMTRLRVRAANNIISPGSPDPTSPPPDPSQLTNRSGRLLRALGGARGRDGGGSNESRLRTESRDGVIVTTFEVLVPYAGVHEYGGSIPSYSILMTPKMRAFLWAKYYETKLDKFKFAALKRGVTIPARTMPARPFVRPAIDDLQDDILPIVRDELRKEFGRVA